MPGFGVTEPTEQQKAFVEEVLYLRGRIVAAYAQVEFLLADISVKLDLRFPYLIDARIKAVRRIAEREGYEVYKDDLNGVCEELLHYDEIRHFMTHGFLSLYNRPKRESRVRVSALPAQWRRKVHFA